jgi:hypothetical protein
VDAQAATDPDLDAVIRGDRGNRSPDQPQADNVFTGHPQVAQPAASFRSSGRNQPHERMSHDRCSSVENQLQWMRDTGVSELDCSFKAWRFAVLSDRR